MEALKLELVQNLEQKGITIAKAAEAIALDPHLLGLYLVKDSNPVPKRIMDKLSGLLQ